MENNENNVQNQVKQKGKGAFIVLVIIILILTLIIGILGGYILSNNSNIFNKNEIQSNSVNSTNNENKNQTREEENTNLSNIIAFTTGLDDYVYAVTKDGNNIKLLNMKDYMTDRSHGCVRYAYSNGRLYMYINSNTPGKYDVNTGVTTIEPKETHQFGYIDLNVKDGEYTYNKLADVDLKRAPDEIAFSDGNIYYCLMDSYNKESNTVKYIMYKFNIDTKKIGIDNIFIIPEANHGVNIKTVNNSLVAYADVSGIYLMNIVTGEKTTITTDTNKYLEYVHGNKVILMDAKYGETYWKYFEYDIDNKTEKQISGDSQHQLGMTTSGIVPKDDYYIYIKDNGVYKYADSTEQKLGEFGTSVSDIFLISEDSLGVVWLEGQVEHKSILNLKNNEIKNDADLTTFTSIIYLK